MTSYDVEVKLASFNRKLNNLCSNFCCRVKTCLGISSTGDASLVLNQQGDWVSSSSGSVISVVSGLGVSVNNTNPENPIVSLGAPFTSGWIDYSAISTVVGWSSFSTKQIYYKISDDNKTMHVYIVISGTSNSPVATCTLPNTVLPGFSITENAIVRDNGTQLSGLTSMNFLSNVIQFFTSASASSFIALGSKSVNKIFTIPIQ